MMTTDRTDRYGLLFIHVVQLQPVRAMLSTSLWTATACASDTTAAKTLPQLGEAASTLHAVADVLGYGWRLKPSHGLAVLRLHYRQ